MHVAERQLRCSETAIAQCTKIAADPPLFEVDREGTHGFAAQKAKDALHRNRDDWNARADANRPALAAHRAC